ncbi:MAG: hypothetical protein HQK78_15900, partial [Desulfobacterales bacterium]|nr:hypothetical protein [Desulfobacterales bacterium]
MPKPTYEELEEKIKTLEEDKKRIEDETIRGEKLAAVLETAGAVCHEL